MCNRMLIFFSWFYESMHTGFQLMDRISSHLMMRFMIVLILWVCKRIFSEAFMHMVDQSCFNIIFFLGFFIMMYDCLKSLASMINQWFMHGILFPLAFCFHKLEMRFASQGDRYLHMSNKWELEILYIDMFS